MPQVFDRKRTADSRLKKAPPPNSIRFYRQKAGLTLEGLAALLNTNHQTIGKLENRQTNLTPEWADRIGARLGGIPSGLIAFSDAPDAYLWAARSVSVIGTVDSGLQIRLRDIVGRRVGITNKPPKTVALELTDNAIAPMNGWLLLYDEDARERVSAAVLKRQERNAKFIVCLADGTAWWRRIVPSSRRGRYHLEAEHKPPVYDADIESVTEVIGFERPGLDLPPPE
jgi:plasmid maintenance system antidote protein VapI